MKWTIAGAGVLLSVAGAYAVITGSSIIQIERGWATFIAGAVLLSGGIITLGIAALMGRIDNLTEVYIASIESLDAPEEQPQVIAAPQETVAPMAAARAEPQPSNENAALPPAYRETRAFQPAFTPAPIPEPVPEPVALAPAPVEPAPEPAPAPALRDFKFVFPPAEAAPEPAPAPIPLARPAPLDIAKPAVAAASSLTWLRRNKQKAEEIAQAPAPIIAPEPEPEPIVEPAPEPVREMAVAEPEGATRAGENFDDQRFAPEPETLHAPEPVAEEPARTETKPEPASTPDPFSNDWLERALSGSDEPRLAPASLRREPVAEAPIEPPAPAPEVHEEPAPQLAVIESEPVEPVVEQAPEREPEPEPVEAAEGPAPVEIGRYRANDVAYVMFSDGSITAETPAGASYRFNSLVELRAFIERGGS